MRQPGSPGGHDFGSMDRCAGLSGRYAKAKQAVVVMRPNAIPSAPSTSCAKKPIPIRAKNSGVKEGLAKARQLKSGIVGQSKMLRN